MRKKLFALTMTWMFSLPLTATVDMKNLNFTDEWIDFKMPTTGFELNVTRTYNSRTLHNGIFGFGWCSNFETSLEQQASGVVKIQYCGAGSTALFYPDGFSDKDLKSFVGQIVNAHKKSGTRYSKKQEKEFYNVLLGDPARRAELAQKYKIRFPVSSNKFVSASSGTDVISKKGTNFFRTRTDGVVEIYDAKGLLREKRDKNGNFQKFTYQGNLLSRIINQQGQQLTFSYYANKKVKEIKGPSDLSAQYKYDKSDLVWVKNAWNNQYSYTVDSLHNITKIAYPDKTTREIKYDNDKDWVVAFKDREGCTESYKVEFDSKDPRNHFWTSLVKKCGKRVTNKSKFEFWYATNKKRGHHLARVKTAINGKVKDVSYHPTLARPIKETENGKTVTYTYYDNGLIKTRRDNGVLTSFKYDPKTKKIVFVKKGKLKSYFSYDRRGNLVAAKNSKGQKIKLDYDRAGRIVALIDHAKRLVKIKYNSKIGKPSVVERPGLGSIFVKYDANGNIKNVNSKAGPAVAVQVASAFNNLLEIVKPAGVELGL